MAPLDRETVLCSIVCLCLLIHCCEVSCPSISDPPSSVCIPFEEDPLDVVLRHSYSSSCIFDLVRLLFSSCYITL